MNRRKVKNMQGPYELILKVFVLFLKFQATYLSCFIRKKHFLSIEHKIGDDKYAEIANKLRTFND